MSEKIYAWLLRLYPSRFRAAYGEEALQLFRDRCRDETGFLPRLRLWLDLLSDLALSVPREHFHVQPELTSHAAHLRSDGGPSLLVLEDESLGRGALLFGGVLALAAAVSFSVLLNHGVKHVPLSALIRPARGAADHRSSSSAARSREPGGDSQERAVVPTTGEQPAVAANSSPPGDAASNSESMAPRTLDSSRPSIESSLEPSDAARATRRDAQLDRAERQRVVDRAAANLKQHYIDPDIAQKMSDALVEHEKNGDDDTVTDGGGFADMLTRQMRAVSHDRHLEVLFSEALLPEHPPASTPRLRAGYRKAMEQANCTFEPVKILPHNIGYLKVDSFPDPAICKAKAAAAMASLNDAAAIIFDLRDNRGGYPSMVILIAAYLFDHPEYMYNPRENTTEQSWTRSPVPGSQLANKPVFVLTSRRTFSGAEHFSYDLKMLKRATLVGETTGGATDVGTFHRLDDHFGIGIRETTAINPYSEPDWAGIGVEPDVKVKAADALEAAEELALRKLEKK